jgi:serine protease Do
MGVIMIRRSVFCFVLMFIVCFAGFGQAAAIRDYVGMISQVFHPDIVSFLQRLRDELSRRSQSQAVKAIDNYLKGESGSGFVYRAADGKNYIITNFHVISQADTLTVTFEKPGGERTLYSGLSIVAVDKDMDIALLAFPEDQNPFREGLAFLNRPVQEGENVFSAGFPGFGTVMVWQWGSGIISNSFVSIPDPDDDTKWFGPYIQHTAQVDPGNSGGPLLVQTPGVPTGYAVAGINTATASRRQATNFSIPTSRVQSFLETSLKPTDEDELTRLNARLDSFTGGFRVTKAVYPHIAEYLSNSCTGENAEYALGEVLRGASKTVQDNIFDRDPVDAMAFSVAWLIENNLRSQRGSISVTKNSVTPAGDGRYTVSFNVNGKTIDSEWVNEYGNWRIRTFGDFASGDKTLIEKRKRASSDANLRANPSLQVSAGFTQIFDRGAGFGTSLVIRSGYAGYGFGAYFDTDLDFFQIDVITGLYFPIKARTVAFTPFIDMGFGVQVKSHEDFLPFDFGFTFKPGLQFTTAAVPGLYFQAAYQYNLMLFDFLRDLDGGGVTYPDRHFVSFSIGYAF